jgi:TolA-binding protein
VTRRAAGLALGLLLIASLCGADPASDLLASGKGAFADGQYALAARTLQRLVEEFPEFPRADEAAYLLGVSLFSTARYEQCLSVLGQLRGRSPRSALAARAAYWQGAAHLRLGRAEKALELLAVEAARTGPDAFYRPHATVLAGAALEELGRDGEAAARYRAFLAEKAPSDGGESLSALRAEALFRLAGTEYRAGRYSAARDMYAKVLLDHPRSPLVRDSGFFLGECELALGNLSGAEKRYRTVLDLYPDSPYRDTAGLRLAEIAARAGRRTEALGQVDAALKRSGAAALSGATRGDALRLRGDILYDLGRHEEALASYGRALELLGDVQSPARGEGGPRQAVQYGMGLCQLALGRDAEAARLFDAARDGPSRETAEKAGLQLGGLLAGQGRHREAARALERLLAEEPGSARAEEALRLLATQLEKAGDWSAAVSRWDSLVRDFPRSQSAAEYLYRRGLALLKVDRDAAALEDFQRVVKEFPQSPLRGECSYSIGFVYSRRGEHGRAVPFFQAALQGQPSADLAQRAGLAAGISLFNTGSYEKALASFEALRKRATGAVEQGTIVLHVGRTLYRMERLQDAATRLREAAGLLKSRPDGAEALYWLGWSLFRLNRLEESRNAFLELADGFPSEPRRAEALLRAGVCETLRPDDAAAVPLFEKAAAAARELQGSAAAGAGDVREQALYEKAWALSRLGRAEEADDAFAALAREFPEGRLAPEAFFRRASQSLEQGRHAEAREGFTRVARSFPKSPVADQALYWAAEAALASGSAKQAAEDFWLYLSTRPRGAMIDPAREGFERALTQEGSTALAAQYAVRAQAQKGLPSETVTRTRLAHARLLLRESPADALALLSELRRKPPAEPLAGQLNLVLGQAYAAAGQGARALDIFTALADSRADRVGAEAKREQASALEEAGRTAEAMDEFVRISYLFPDFPDLAAEGLYNAVRIALRRGERDRARSFEDSLRKSFPDSSWIARLSDLR